MNHVQRASSALVAVLALSLGACVSEASSEDPLPPTELVSEEGKAEVVVVWPAPVRRGENAFDVRVTNSGATLKDVTAFMPAHGHGTEGVRVDLGSDGYKVDALALYMPGRWEVTLLLDTPTGADQVRFGVSVP